MYEVLAFSAILTSVAFFISSFAVFWPEYRAAQKRDAAGTDGMAETDGLSSMAGTVGTAGSSGAAGAAGTARTGFGQSGNFPGYNPVGPEDMKRYRFNSCPAQEEEEEEKEVLTMAARH
jgi:hypothetical protein